MRRLSVLVVLAAALSLVTATDTSGAGAPIRVVGIDRIGPFDIRRHDLGDARRVFGEPTSAVERNGGCLLTWKGLGLRLRFYTLLRERQCDSRSSFESAAISGPWETGRGLARGDRASRARVLYPRSAPLVHPFPFADLASARSGSSSGRARRSATTASPSSSGRGVPAWCCS